MNELTRAEFAEIMKMDPETIRSWESKLNLEIPRNKLGYRVYTEKEKEIFEAVKGLKESHSFKSIIRIIGVDKSKSDTKENDQISLEKTIDLQSISNHIIESLNERFDTLLSISEVSNDLNQQIGFLKALLLSEKQNTQKILEQSEQDKRLISDNNTTVYNLKKINTKQELDLKNALDEVEDLRNKLIQVNTDLYTEKNKNLFQRLFK